MKKIIIVMILLVITIFPLDYRYNGKKLVISDDKIEKAFENSINNFRQQYGNDINLDEIKTLVFINVLEQEILLNSSYANSIKISDSEVEKAISEIKEGFFDSMTYYETLEKQGFTKESLFEEVKENILLNKTKEKIYSTVKISKSEVENFYKENKYSTYFIGFTYEDVRKEITESLLEKKKGEALRYFIENETKKIVFSKTSKYSKYFPKIVYKKAGFDFTNIDFANRKIMGRIQGITDEETLEKMVKEGIDNELKIVTKAKEAQVEIDEALSRDDKISAYREAYQRHLIEATKVTEKEIKEYFKLNKEKYFIPETCDVNLIELPIEILDEDKKIIKDKAQQILNLALSEDDFGELARKYSEDGSAQDGGNLGWFSKGQMIKTFEKVSFEGEIGKVVPYLVETEFGYHIVKVNDRKMDGSEVNASHILLLLLPLENSKFGTEKKVKDIIEQINNKKLTFSEAAKYSIIEGKYEFKNIKKGRYIENIGENELLEEAIFSSRVNELSYFVGDEAYIFVKTKQSSELEPTLENSMERVKYDLVRDIVSEKLLKVYK